MGACLGKFLDSTPVSIKSVFTLDMNDSLVKGRPLTNWKKGPGAAPLTAMSQVPLWNTTHYYFERLPLLS